MRGDGVLDELMGLVDPASQAPPVSAGAGDPVPRQIMAMGDRLGWTDVGLAPPARRWSRPAVVAGATGVALVLAAIVFVPNRNGLAPASWGATVGAGNPGQAFNMGLGVPAGAPAPVRGCAAAWATWVPPDVVWVDEFGATIGGTGHDPASAAPNGQAWPTITVTITPGQPGAPARVPEPVPSAGAIVVMQSPYRVDTPDDRTIVLHGPDGSAAATLVDLGPAVPQVEVRDATGAIVGAVDYVVSSGGVNVVVDEASIHLGSSWGGITATPGEGTADAAPASVEPETPIPAPTGQGGRPATLQMTLLWSSSRGVVLPSATPVPSPSLLAPPIQTGPDGLTTPSRGVPAPLGLVLVTPVGGATVAVFSSSAGTVVCMATPDGAGGFDYEFSYLNDYFDAALADASPDAVYYLAEGQPGIVSSMDGGEVAGQAFVAGGLGADVRGLVVNLSDQTQVTARIEAPFWLATYPARTSDGRAVEMISVTATLADGTTTTIGW